MTRRTPLDYSRRSSARRLSMGTLSTHDSMFSEFSSEEEEESLDYEIPRNSNRMRPTHTRRYGRQNLNSSARQLSMGTLSTHASIFEGEEEEESLDAYEVPPESSRMRQTRPRRYGRLNSSARQLSMGSLSTHPSIFEGEEEESLDMYEIPNQMMEGPGLQTRARRLSMSSRRTSSRRTLNSGTFHNSLNSSAFHNSFNSREDFDIMSNMMFSRAGPRTASKAPSKAAEEEWDSCWESLYTMDDESIYTHLSQEKPVLFEGLPEATTCATAADAACPPGAKPEYTVDDFAMEKGLRREEVVEMMRLLRHPLADAAAAEDAAEEKVAEADYPPIAEVIPSQPPFAPCKLETPEVEEEEDEEEPEELQLPAWMTDPNWTKPEEKEEKEEAEDDDESSVAFSIEDPPSLTPAEPVVKPPRRSSSAQALPKPPVPTAFNSPIVATMKPDLKAKIPLEPEERKKWWFAFWKSSQGSASWKNTGSKKHRFSKRRTSLLSASASSSCEHTTRTEETSQSAFNDSESSDLDVQHVFAAKGNSSSTSLSLQPQQQQQPHLPVVDENGIVEC